MEGVFSIIGNEVKPQHSVADPDLELKKGGGCLLLALLAFLPSVILFFFFHQNKEGA